MRNILSLHLASYTLVLTLLLSACGGGGGDAPAQPPVQPPPAQQWPQSVAFTDFTGGQKEFGIAYVSTGGPLGPYGPLEESCLLCVSLLGVARSNAEMASLLKDFANTPQNWPAPYNDKPYGELPIDYNSKMAVVLEDRLSGTTYANSIQKVEESAEAITVSVVKCSFGLLVSSPAKKYYGLLIPKSSKSVQVVTLPSPNPPVYPGSGQLGAC